MDNAAFTSIDRMLFDRLHWGALDPITFHLKDGRTVTGHLLGVYRSGAVGECGGALSGALRLSAEAGETALSYEQISEIE